MSFNKVYLTCKSSNSIVKLILDELFFSFNVIKYIDVLISQIINMCENGGMVDMYA